VRARAAIEGPAPPVTVARRVHPARRRPCRRQTHRPPADLTGAAGGQRRRGGRSVSPSAPRREVGRRPVRVLRAAPAAAHGLAVGGGGIVGARRPAAGRAAPPVAAILARIRASPVVHADERGGRAAGGNGDIRAVGTPTARRFRRGSRRQGMGDAAPGEDVGGTPVSDSDAAHGQYPGLKQRRWAHPPRAIDDRRREPPQDPGLAGRAEAVRAVWARASGACPPPAERGRRRRARGRELVAPWQPSLADGAARRAVLGRRLERRLSGPFVSSAWPTRARRRPTPPPSAAAGRR
jgi:hypothetical protein